MRTDNKTKEKDTEPCLINNYYYGVLIFVAKRPVLSRLSGEWYSTVGFIEKATLNNKYGSLRKTMCISTKNNCLGQYFK